MQLEEALAKIKEYESTTEDLNSQLEKLKANNESLVNEKRSVAEKARQLEEDKKAKDAELAKKNGDYESLAKALEEEKNKTQEELTGLKQRVAKKEIDSIAAKLANEIAIDTDSASILQEQFAKRLIFEDEQVKIKNEKGSTVSTFEQLKDEFLKTTRYQRLIKGNSASGGRPINANGGAVPQTDSNRKLSPVERLNRARGIN